MEYIHIERSEQLDEINNLSHNRDGVLIFKHSTRCAISNMALGRFKRGWDVDSENVPVYYLDILKYRKLSDNIAEKYGIQHESPQLLHIKNGKCEFHLSHYEIEPSFIQEAIK